MALDEFDGGSTELRDVVNDFKEKEPTPHVRSAVYGIFDAETRACLYIGEAKWLISRLNDHYNTRTGSQIKAFVENDDEIDIDASNVWERTAVKYVSGIDGGQKGRKEVESVLIEELNPRYNTR
ncbi:GIY-YIG nuclease family protein [Halosegnis longus]|uniref:GIY-YIG domain-containing protein n=1 Tax=Halosegnis longus TaxID=2216012 RepID=A0AAJ4R7H7_9EURY|nr:MULTISPECIES: GIY-YIG nuclease family protein [Halobacteriales]RNJ25677.1 hypothetical protein Nmn1133_02560 [Salella cibi]